MLKFPFLFDWELFLETLIPPAFLTCPGQGLIGSPQEERAIEFQNGSSSTCSCTKTASAISTVSVEKGILGAPIASATVCHLQCTDSLISQDNFNFYITTSLSWWSIPVSKRQIRLTMRRLMGTWNWKYNGVSYSPQHCSWHWGYNRHCACAATTHSTHSKYLSQYFHLPLGSPSPAYCLLHLCVVMKTSRRIPENVGFQHNPPCLYYTIANSPCFNGS